MLDCGFALAETEARLARAGLAPPDLAGVIVTHEHGDHADGVLPFARRHAVPVWMTYGTFAALRDAGATVEDCAVHLVDSHRAFTVGDLLVQPFTVPHDAREPVQYVLSDGARRLGVLTDAGCATAHIKASLSGCEALVIECNYDPGMLEGGPYPPSVKARIASRLGHLDNATSGEILSTLDRTRLRHVIAAHLSQTNNTPALARAALAQAMACEAAWISVATQDEGFGWREI